MSVDPEEIERSMRAAHEAHRRIEEEERMLGHDPASRAIEQFAAIAPRLHDLVEPRPSRWRVIADDAPAWLEALALAAIAARLWWA